MELLHIDQSLWWKMELLYDLGDWQETGGQLPIPILSHPPSYPDLNRIEGCWNLVEQQLRMQDGRATSLDGLWINIQRIRSDDHWTLDRMIWSMLVRREAALSVQGPATRW